MAVTRRELAHALRRARREMRSTGQSAAGFRAVSKFRVPRIAGNLKYHPQKARLHGIKGAFGLHRTKATWVKDKSAPHGERRVMKRIDAAGSFVNKLKANAGGNKSAAVKKAWGTRKKKYGKSGKGKKGAAKKGKKR